PSAVVPSIASKWAPTPDQLHWDFTLRPDVRFANGRQITSADVKYTLERIAQKGSTSPVALQLEPVTGYKAFNADGTAPGLSGITTPAPDVVHVDLDQPLSSLPAVLGNPAFGIVPRESVEAKPPLPTFADQPVGSGPFVVRSRTADLLHLVPSPGSPALVAGVDVSLEPDVTASYRAFAAGQLDWSLVPPGRAGEVSRIRGRVDLHPLAAEL